MSLFFALFHLAQAGVEILDQRAVTGGVVINALFEPGTKPQEVLVGNPATPATVRAAAVDLSILVDVSALCRAEKIESRFQNLLGQLKTELHRSSRVSVIAYSAEARLLLADAVTPDRLSDVRLLCTGRAQSVGPEVAFPLLFRERTTDSTPLVWILSGGNVGFSPQALAQLREKNVGLRTYIYSAVLYPTLEPALKYLANQLGKKFGFGPWANESLPGLPLEVRWTAPWSWQGQTRLLNLRADPNPPVVFESALGASLISEAVGVFTGSTGWFWSVVLIAVLGGFLFKVYSPRRCRDCKQTYAREDGFCLSCHPVHEAFVRARVGDRTRFLRFRRDRSKVGAVTIFQKRYVDRHVYVARSAVSGLEVALPYYRPVQVGAVTLELMPGRFS